MGKAGIGFSAMLVDWVPTRGDTGNQLEG